MTFAAHVRAAAEEACDKCHFVLHFSTFVEETAIRCGIRIHAELCQASLRFPRIEESAPDNGQNGTLNGYTQRPSVMRINLVDSFPPTTGEELLQQHIKYRRRSGRLLRISAEDVARMVTDFAASHGGITRYPPTYAAPSCQYRIKPPMVGTV
jgi:hypothetical protein